MSARRVGEHAIVIGASIAGLLVARVLSDAFDHVTVLDRDTLPDGLSGHRRAVPQGSHAHGFQLAGQEALERMLPGFMDAAIAAGAAPVKPALDMRFVLSGHPLPRVRIGSDAAIASRPFIEGLVRRRVCVLPNVAIRDRCDAVALTSQGGRVSGVRVLDRAPGSAEQVLEADLVVAASGRGGRVGAWLEAMGFQRPVEERIEIDIRYASRQVRLARGALDDDRILASTAMPGHPRGFGMLSEEDGRWMFTLYGYGAADHPPDDDAGFAAFAATVVDARLLAALQQAEPLGEITTHAYPAGVRRRYDRLRRFPDGLLVVGDAMCSFNPIYGQGMTVAALEAEALQRCLRVGDRRLARRFFKAANVPVGHAWQLATAADRALPEVCLDVGLPDRIASRYVERLLTAAEHDAALTRSFLRVLAMVQTPAHLLSPAVALRVLRGGSRRDKGGQTEPSLSR